jgi:spoIIIJ-associated protein
MGDENEQLDEGWEDESNETETEASATTDDAESSTTTEGGKKRRRRRGPREEYLPTDDARAIQALEFVQKVLTEMGFDCRARLKRPDPSDENPEIVVEIVGNDTSRVIGKKGQVLSALQFLTHRVINRPNLDRRHVLVDAEGYRSRRDDSLATMAKRLGQQALELGKVITFEPMNPRDRRVVHLALAKFEGVITRSDGEGDDRRVQIIPVRRTP